MSIEVDTFHLHYKKPFNGDLFLAEAHQKMSETLSDVADVFRLYEGVAQRIIRERNAVVPESADWGYYGWSGLMISIRLRKNEGFDIAHDFYEYLSFQTRHARADTPVSKRCCEPEASDYAVIMRRAFTFQIGKAKCTLCIFANEDSDICKKVETGTEPTYELVCAGSPIAA
jgi:hypothetical protein